MPLLTAYTSLASPYTSMLVSRTTDDPEAGGSSGFAGPSSASSPSRSSSSHSAVGTSVIVPIVLVIALAVVVTALFSLYCRRVLRRSRQPTVRWEARHTRPDLWEVSLEPPETRLSSLQDLKVRETPDYEIFFALMMIV